jgi:hypothetical protein
MLLDSVILFLFRICMIRSSDLLTRRKGKFDIGIFNISLAHSLSKMLFRDNHGAIVGLMAWPMKPNSLL